MASMEWKYLFDSLVNETANEILNLADVVFLAIHCTMIKAGYIPVMLPDNYEDLTVKSTGATSSSQQEESQKQNIVLPTNFSLLTKGADGTVVMNVLPKNWNQFSADGNYYMNYSQANIKFNKSPTNLLKLEASCGDEVVTICTSAYDNLSSKQIQWSTKIDVKDLVGSFSLKKSLLDSNFETQLQREEKILHKINGLMPSSEKMMQRISQQFIESMEGDHILIDKNKKENQFGYDAFFPPYESGPRQMPRYIHPMSGGLHVGPDDPMFDLPPRRPGFGIDPIDPFGGTGEPDYDHLIPPSRPIPKQPFFPPTNWNPSGYRDSGPF